MGSVAKSLAGILISVLGVVVLFLEMLSML